MTSNVIPRGSFRRMCANWNAPIPSATRTSQGTWPTQRGQDRRCRDNRSDERNKAAHQESIRIGAAKQASLSIEGLHSTGRPVLGTSPALELTKNFR
jgi:hypothetical protein